MLDFWQRFIQNRPSNLQGPRKWFDLRFTQGTAEVLIYDVIGADFWGDGLTAKDFINELNRVRDAERITLRINSPGGDIADGIAIRNALIEHPAPVDARIEGLAASTASWVALAGDTVEIAPNAMMMIHEPFNIAMGDAAEFRKQANVLDKFGEDIASMYAKKAGGDVSAWRDLMRAETWYTDQEAVDAGLADTVSGTQAQPANRGSDNWNLMLRLFNKTPQQLIPPEAPAPAPENQADLLPGKLAYLRNRVRLNGVQV